MACKQAQPMVTCRIPRQLGQAELAKSEIEKFEMKGFSMASFAISRNNLA